MSWVVYCLATGRDPVCTYIGATVDADRRLAQHNGQQKGGAKATSRRPGEWYRVCHVVGFADNHQALSFEWHWKNFSRKINADPLTRRQRGLDACMAWAGEKFEGVSLEIVYG